MEKVQNTSARYLFIMFLFTPKMWVAVTHMDGLSLLASMLLGAQLIIFLNG